MTEPRCYAETQEEPHGPSTQIIFRYGYAVGEAAPRFVGHTTAKDGIYWRNALEAAEKFAEASASEVREKLAEIGAPTDVSWWVQQRTTACEVTYGDPIVKTLEKGATA